MSKALIQHKGINAGILKETGEGYVFLYNQEYLADAASAPVSLTLPLTDKGNTYSRPLEAFPILLEATPEQRVHYEIGLDGDDIRWDDIDEDIHISSFFVTAEPDTNNPIVKAQAAKEFRRG